MFSTLDNIINSVSPSPVGALSRFGTAGKISGIIINLILGLGFSIGILAITASMFMYITSGGNPDKTKRAGQAFIYGVIGTALSIGIFTLKNIVVNAIGVSSTDIQTVPGF